jgi:glycerol uptake facilitator-like aquaporin
VILALLAALAEFLRTLWRVARQLFHEVTGALFVLFAVVGAASVWHEWRRGSAEWLIGLAVAFTLMMAYFALASFRSARRVR